MDIRSDDEVARPEAVERYCLPGVFARHEPAVDLLAPVVVDSPHSGREYPSDFVHAPPLHLLKGAEDAFVDELVADAPHEGAQLLTALFPRTYIDPNRHESDIDEALLAEPWPRGARPTRRSRRGLGLLRRMLSPTIPIYDRPLAVSEVERRLEDFYRPYHGALKSMLDGAHARFGAVWHVNMHSMKAKARGRDARPRADFVLGDLDGAACEPDFTAAVRDKLLSMGYSVRLNDPFKGAEIISRYSAPRTRRHSLQIEINRRLYFDEALLAKTDGFAKLRMDMRSLLASVVAYARCNL
jgi:N-formylglutamate deformylase